MKKITGLSPAKVNLTLDVLSPKPGENFHRLKTIYHQIALADEIEIQEARTFGIQGNFDCPPDQNLISKAFSFLESYHQRMLPKVKVVVQKNIPAGGGLGGGSSNFAHFIKLYHALFELGPIPEKMVAQTASYGKDIPLFFEPKKCSLGERFGEWIKPLDFNFSEQKICLYQPKFQNSTADLFRHLRNYNTRYTEKFIKCPTLALCGNAFDYILEQKKYSEIIPLQKDGFHVTGTGSCFFGFQPIRFPEGRIWETKFL